MMRKQLGVSFVLFMVVLSGCARFSKVEEPPRVRDIQISGQDSISPVELYADVGDEIRWHNDLSTPIYLGFLGVRPVEEAACGKGLKNWYGEIKDLVTIRAGEYVSLCPNRTGTIRYNVWTDLADPVRSMSKTAVIHIEEPA